MSIYLPSAFGLIVADYRFEYRFMYAHGDGIIIPKSEFGKFDSIRFVQAIEYTTQQYDTLFALSNYLSAGGLWDSPETLRAFENIHGYNPFYSMEFDCEPLNTIYGWWCGSREIPSEYRSASQKLKPKSKREPNPGYIYLVKAVTPDNHYKIGLSVNPVTRIESMGVLLPFPIEPVHQFPTNDMARAEKTLHDRYALKRVNGEWFDLSPDDVEDIFCIQRMDFTGGS